MGLLDMLSGLSAYQIYVQLTSGPGAGSIHQAQRAAATIRDTQSTRAQLVTQLMGKIDAGWQGSSAQAAHSSAQPLQEQAVRSARLLHVAQDLLTRDAESFERARREVRPVAPNPPQSTILDTLMPWQNDFDQQVRQYQQDAHHNIAIFDTYDGASLYNETNMPTEFGTVADSGVDISVIPPAGSGPASGSAAVTGDGSGPGVVNPVEGGGGGPQPPSGGNPPVVPVPGEHVQPLVPRVVDPAAPRPGTDPEAWTPTPEQPANPTTTSVSTTAAATTSTSPAIAATSSGSAYLPGTGRGTAATPSPREGTGRTLERPRTETGSGGGRSLGRGAAGPPGTGGFVPGRGKAEGEEDYEHQTASYLENPDPDATFGDGRATTPPVIGE